MVLPFHKFAYYAERISNESADTAKIELLSELFQEAGDDLGTTTRFVRGQIFPEWDERKTGVGGKLLQRAVGEAAGLDNPKGDMEELVIEHGDIGESARTLSFNDYHGLQQSGQVTVDDVYKTFAEVARTSGSGSQQAKIDLISSLIQRLDAHELEEGTVVSQGLQAKYIAQLVDTMRIGVGDGMVRDAIAEAFDVPVDAVEHAFMVLNNSEEVAHLARDEGVEGLKSASMNVGRPIQLMLAQTGEIDELIEDWGAIIADYKYDGARLQIHKDGDDIHLFTRNYEDWTDSLPEVVEQAKEEIDAEEAIVDAEVVGYEPHTNHPKDFTEVMTRGGRKYDIEEEQEQTEMRIHAFDLLYLDGEEYINHELETRFEILESICSEEIMAKQTRSDTSETIKEFNKNAISEGHEGLVMKQPGSTYSPGKRGMAWRKLKPDFETIDCVVLGGTWGQGDREGTIGSYKVGVKDESSGEFKEISAIGTGLTEKQLEHMTELFEDKIIAEDGLDVEFEKDVVFEVGFEEIYESPDKESGWGLRFPRFLGIRDDKDASDIDTLERVEKWVNEQ